MKDAMVWTLTRATRAMFLMAGGLKVAGVEMEVQLFATLGIGQWFRYVTGLLEIGGAIGLFVPALASTAAMVLAAVMVAAIGTHLFIVGRSPIAAIVLLASSLTVVRLRGWLRGQQISSRRVAVA